MQEQLTTRLKNILEEYPVGAGRWMSQKQSFPKPLFLLTTDARDNVWVATESDWLEWTTGVCCELTGPFKEFLQNADDAQARRFAVCVGPAVQENVTSLVASTVCAVLYPYAFSRVCWLFCEYFTRSSRVNSFLARRLAVKRAHRPRVFDLYFLLGFVF
jgi:hypothetical protein